MWRSMVRWQGRRTVFSRRNLVLVGERKTVKCVRLLTLRVDRALGLLRRSLVSLLSIGWLLDLLSFPAFSHICYEWSDDLFLFFV